LEAYSRLLARLDLHDGIPYTETWSAGADFVELIVEHALTTQPTMIVECSSGLTTVALARCCQQNGSGKLYSLESGPEYANKTRSYFERYSLNSCATVIDAPLQNYTIEDVDYQWYAIDGIPSTPIEMLVIDGPPGFIQKHSRFPALPLLYEQLADGCKVFMDDAARDDERELVEMWCSRWPLLEHDYIETERGCSILTINK